MNIETLFNIWNKDKQRIHKKGPGPYFSDREIWWVQFGQNIASEIYGKGDDFLRPAIIFRKVFDDACIILPLTSKQKSGNYYFKFKYQNKFQYVYLSQIRYIDAKRLHHKLGQMKIHDFKNLQKQFIQFITKNNPPIKIGGNPQEGKLVTKS